MYSRNIFITVVNIKIPFYPFSSDEFIFKLHRYNILSIIRKKLDNVCDKNNVKSNKNNSIKECPYPSLECLPKKFIKVFMMSQSGLSVEEIVKKEKISRDYINNILYLCNLKINSSDGKG